MDEHGERPPAEIERPHIEPAGFGRGGKDGAKPGLGLAVAGERRSRAPLPAARFQIEKGVDPCVKRLARAPVADRHRALLGKPVRSEEHTSELQSLLRTSYAVSCL